MNITVFGASGKVGRRVVARALDNGHRVVANVHSRNPFTEREGLTVRVGDVTDAGTIDDALENADTVISTLGTFGKGGTDVLTEGMRAIIPAMQRRGLKRIVTLTGAGAAWRGDRRGATLTVNRIALRLMEAGALRDAEAHLALLADSPLEWTTVRAPGIRAEGADGYRLSPGVPSLLTGVNAPAVAHSLVDLVEHPDYIRQAPGIHLA